MYIKHNIISCINTWGENFAYLFKNRSTEYSKIWHSYSLLGKEVCTKLKCMCYDIWNEINIKRSLFIFTFIFFFLICIFYYYVCQCRQFYEYQERIIKQATNTNIYTQENYFYTNNWTYIFDKAKTLQFVKYGSLFFTVKNIRKQSTLERHMVLYFIGMRLYPAEVTATSGWIIQIPTFIIIIRPIV